MGKVIVTGAFGTLGRAVVANLTTRGHAVAAVDLAPVPDGFVAAVTSGPRRGPTPHGHGTLCRVVGGLISGDFADRRRIDYCSASI